MKPQLPVVAMYVIFNLFEWFHRVYYVCIQSHTSFSSSLTLASKPQLISRGRHDVLQKRTLTNVACLVEYL